MTQDTPARDAGSPVLSFLRFLVWPVLIFAALVLFRDPLSDFVRKLGKAEIVKDDKGIKLALVVAANLGAAEASRSETNTVKPSADLDKVPAAALRAAGASVLSSARVLWVDDNPDNNLYERAALAALGVKFVLALNTDDAVKRLKEDKFNLVISDFKRKDDPQGGYTLLAELKKLAAAAPPLIIYSGPASPESEREAKARGAFAETNSPQRLFDLSINAILGK